MPTKKELIADLETAFRQNKELRRHHTAAQELAALLDMQTKDYDNAPLRHTLACFRDLMDVSNQTDMQINILKQGGIAVGLLRAAWIIDHGPNMTFFVEMMALAEIALRLTKAGKQPVELGLAMDPNLNEATIKLLKNA